MNDRSHNLSASLSGYVSSGTIHVGQRLELREDAPESNGAVNSNDSSNRYPILPIDHERLNTRSDDVPRQRSNLQLADTEEAVYIADHGVTRSYCVFGQPGSGKTRMLLYLTRQILHRDLQSPEERTGALILDPKAELLEGISSIMYQAGRGDDLLVLKPQLLRESGIKVNVVDCYLHHNELADALAFSAQNSPEGGVADPLCAVTWRDLLADTIYLIRHLEEDPPTLRRLLDAVSPASIASGSPMVRDLVQLMLHRLPALPPTERRDASVAIRRIQAFFEIPDHEIILEYYSQIYRSFCQPPMQCLSGDPHSVPTSFKDLYDSIIEDGRVVVVSTSANDANVAQTLCTIMKSIFERTVLARIARLRDGSLTNAKRLVVLVCDEYAAVASPAGLWGGDAAFITLAHACGCMALMATQSISQLQSSALGTSWREVFGVFGASFFMKTDDEATAEVAAGASGDWIDVRLVSDRNPRNDDDGSNSHWEIRERKRLPETVFTELLRRREAVVIGSLDGKSRDTVFVRIPNFP